MGDSTGLAEAQAKLAQELRRTVALNAARHGNPILAGTLDRLRKWQAARLRQTYPDFARHPRYAAALRFLEDDLCGGADFRRRDADLARVVPAMVKLAPAAVVQCVAHAIELNALSQELDLLVVGRLPRANAAFTVSEYCRAYRRAGDPASRRRQIALIGEVGAMLDRYVQKPMLRAALAMMRQPARLAGLSSLQDFLERGFAAFRHMRGADAFLAAVHERETALHEAIMGGDAAPFADPSHTPP